MPRIEPIYQAIILTINAIAADLFVDKSGKIRLVMDRTNWMIGQQHINLLVLGVLIEVPLYKAIFVPLVWQDLGAERKRGNSATADREALINRAMDLLGASTKADLDRFTLLADREFIGQAFWNNMSGRGLHFVIRLRAWMHFEQCANALKMSEINLKKKIEADILREGRAQISFFLGQHQYHLLVIPNLRQGGSQRARKSTPSEKEKLDEKYLFIASDTPCWDTMAETYRLRWKIECCFRHVRTVKYPKISLFRLGADLVNGPLLITIMTKLLILSQLKL